MSAETTARAHSKGGPRIFDSGAMKRDLRARMQRLGHGPEQVAEQIGIDAAAVRRYLRQDTIQLGTLDRIALHYFDDPSKLDDWAPLD